MRPHHLQSPSNPPLTSIPTPVLHPGPLDPASCSKQGVQPGTPSQAPISLNWGRAEARERGPGGARALGLGQPGWEGNPCGKEEVTRSPTGRETPKSESAAESGGSAARAHAGPRPTSWAPVLRAPLPGPLTRAARASAAAGSRADGAELSRSGSPHPSDPGPGGARGLPSGGRDGPPPHLRAILVGSVPPPPSCAPPWAGGSSSVLRGCAPAPCGGRAPSAGPSVCPAPSVRVCPAAALWALDAAHRTSPWRGPRALSGPNGDAPPGGDLRLFLPRRAVSHTGYLPAGVCRWEAR